MSPVTAGLAAAALGRDSFVDAGLLINMSHSATADALDPHCREITSPVRAQGSSPSRNRKHDLIMSIF
jgi:hypothetical protein